MIPLHIVAPVNHVVPDEGGHRNKLYVAEVELLGKLLILPNDPAPPRLLLSPVGSKRGATPSQRLLRNHRSYSGTISAFPLPEIVNVMVPFHLVDQTCSEQIR